MLAESTALGLDATWWTAIASLTALALGLWGILGPPLLAKIRRPKLKLNFGEINQHSELLDDVYHLLVPVSNQAGRIPAANVEVWLVSIVQLHVPEPTKLPVYLPIRLIWSHGGLTKVERIAGGTKRLLDFGKLTFTINSEMKLVELVAAIVEDMNPVLLVFNTEIIPTGGAFGLPVGTYKITFLISSDGQAFEQTAIATVKSLHLRDGKSLGSHLEIT